MDRDEEVPRSGLLLSANLRSSDNTEQMTIFNDPELLAFHVDWLNQLT